jgi:transmembrane sensor
MNAPGHEVPRLKDAMEIDLLAADWLQRQQFWAWSDADQAEFDAWVAESRAHRVAYWRQKAVWTNAQRLVALRPSNMPSGRESKAKSTNLLSRIAAHPLRVAAALAVAALLGGAAAYFMSSPPDRVYATAVGGRETVRFADGTTIELNTNTVLRARMTNVRRIVWLDRGEAFFQAKHDPAHPFTVVADGHSITDVGTEFDVRRDADGLQIALLEGKVRVGAVDSTANSRQATLAPGDVATISGNTVSISNEPIQSLTDELSWRSGVLIFKYRTLADVIGEFNRYNDKKIVIADADVGKLMIFGTFRTQDVDLFARVTQKALGLTVRDEGNQILISR